MDRLAVTSFLAKHIGKGGGVDQLQLANAIAEIEIETRTSGAAVMKVQLVDPYWSLLTSSFIEVQRTTQHVGSEKAELPTSLRKIQVEFPQKSGWMWQIVAVEATNELSQPNLILTFEELIVAQMHEVWGYKVANSGMRTRAEFVAAMVDEVNMRLKQQRQKPIRFVCPSEKRVIEVEESSEGASRAGESGSTSLTAKDRVSEAARVNKSAALGKGSELTVKGVTITPEQEEQANILLGVANAENAPLAAAEALIFAGIAESGLTASPGNGSHLGVLSGSVGAFKQGESQRMAECFLKGGEGFQAGGAIKLADAGATNAVEIAVKVEVPSIWPANAYEHEENYPKFLPEAQAIVNAGGGVRGSLLLGSGATTGESSASQIARGTPENPDEDTWECIQRLASQVRWYAFTNGKKLPTETDGGKLETDSYKRGRFLYYMDAFDFTRQVPAAYLEIPANRITNCHTGKTTTGVIAEGMVGTWDDTTYEYQTTHKVEGKVQRKARIATPATPSELRIPLVCAALEYEAGDVIVIRNSGTFNGRWLVTATARNYIADPFTTLTLEPPLLPYPEPAGEGSGSQSAGTTGVEGVAANAEKAYSEMSKYTYTENLRARENKGTLYGPAPRTMDCSAFATLCYKEAKLPDPSDRDYVTIGTTSSMIPNMVRTSSPAPGDLVFYGSDEAVPQHVVVYIGNGEAIGMETYGVNLLRGPAWGAGNLGTGAGPVIGGTGHAYRLKDE